MRIPIIAVTAAGLVVYGCTPGGRTGSGQHTLLPPKTEASESFGAHTPERIIAECTKAIARDSTCAWAYYYRALAWASFGVEDEARKDMAYAVSLNSSYREKYGEIQSIPAAGRNQYVSSPNRHYPSFQRAEAPSAEVLVAHSSVTPLPYSSGDSVKDPPRRQSDSEPTPVSTGTDSSEKAYSNRKTAQDSVRRVDENSFSSSDSIVPRDKYIQSLIRQEMSSTGERESLSERNRQKRRAFLPGKKWETEENPRDSAQPAVPTRDAERHRTIRPSSEDSSPGRHPGAPTRDECPELVMGDTVTVYFCLAKMYYKHKEYEKAIFALNQIIKRERGHSEAYLWKAKTLGAQGKYRKALRAINRSIKITSTNPKAYSIRAWIYHCRGRFRKEAENLREALKLGYDKPDIIKVRLEAIADKID